MQNSYFLWDEDTGNIIITAYLTQDMTSSDCTRYILNRIEVTRYANKGRGLGTTLLQQICNDADKENMPLILGVSPDDDQFFRRLVNWYKKFGFKGTRGRVTRANNVMVRKPQHI